jgi:BirA family transcriptional regulator, biotin operon repressor / biotin---[acetyl-CoA-carboxylase] ligase
VSSKSSDLLPQTSTHNSIGTPLTVLPTVDSTNNYAMAKFHEGQAKHGAAFFALEQTAGKGQRGKSWISVKGENIILSVVLEPTAGTNQFFLLAAIALACHHLFNKRIGNEVFVKWPNDIYWRDRKAGGILIENAYRGNTWSCSIAGMGLNINQTDFSNTADAVSLKQITGKTYDPLELAKELCELIESKLELMQQNPVEIFHQYNQALYKRGMKVKLKKDSSVFETTIQEVDEEGMLITNDTLERRFSFGEVVWLK